MEIVGFGTQIESLYLHASMYILLPQMPWKPFGGHLKNVSFLTVRRLLPKRLGGKI